MVQIISKSDDMVILPSWIPFISKNPQLVLSSNECINESNQYKNESENVFTVQSFLNTLAFSDQLMLAQLKDHLNNVDDMEAINLKNKVTENFWNWTYRICCFIRYNYLKEFDLEAIQNYEYENLTTNDRNNNTINIIHLSTPELTALIHDPMDLDINSSDDEENDDNNKQDTTELEILKIHANLCLELSSMEKDSNIDNEKKVLFLWWFMSYNLLKILNKRLDIYNDEKFEEILGNEMLNEEVNFKTVNFIYSTHSEFDYFPNDLLSYSNYYLSLLKEDEHNKKNVFLLFFKEESDYEHHAILLNVLEKNNMKCIPMTYSSFTTKMEKSQFNKKQCTYESIKTAKNISEFTITNQLGKGSSGFIRNAVHNKTGTKVIIKYVVKSLILKGCWTDNNYLVKQKVNIKYNEMNRKFPNEIAVLQYIHDELNGNVPDNLTTLITYWEDSIYYYLVFADTHYDSDLFDYIDKSPNDTMPENEARTIFKNILDAIQILHHHNIVHRDIKDENVLINYETKEIQLIDFGSSTFYEQDKKLSNFVGSYVFAAPEIIQGLTYEGPPQDIWSLGILLYTMIYKNTPFNDYYEILRGKMKFPSDISKECQELILWMTNRDISKRPTIDDVLSHPWINENSFN